MIWEEKNLTEQSNIVENNQTNVPNDIIKETEINVIKKEWNDIGKLSGIYKIVNKVTGKYYVGSSKDINSKYKGRWVTHKYMLNSKTHPNIRLQRAWNKYGSENFVWEIVELTNIGELLITEQKYLDIAKLEPNKCYNLSFIAGKVEMTPEVIEKLRKANIGRKHTNETKNKLKIIKLGTKHSKETIDKLRELNIGEKNSFYGKKHTEVTKQILRDKRIKSNISKGSNNACYDHTIYKFYNTNSQETFTGTRYDLYTKYSLNPSNVSLVCYKQRPHHKGWTLIGPL